MGYKFAPNYSIPVGEFVVEEMEARGWTRAELADRSGLGRLGLDMLIAGEVRVSQPIAAGLAKAFGTSAELWANLDRIDFEFRNSKSEVAVPVPSGGEQEGE